MWFPPIIALQEGDRSTAFLLSLWHELFDPATPDSFQPKLCHIPALVVELEEIAARALKTAKWEKHVRKIQDELRASCEQEQAFLQTMPRYHWSLLTLARCRNLTEVVSIAKTLQHYDAIYEKQTVSSLEKAIEGLPKTKNAANSALRRLATVALRKGRTAEDFTDLIQANNLGKKPAEVLSALLLALDAKPETFKCVVAVKGNAQELQAIVRKVGFNLTSPKHLSEVVVTPQFEAETSGSIWVDTTVSATKPSDAARSAVKKLRPALDVFNFYRQGSMSICDECLVIPEIGAPVIVKSPRQWLWHIRPRRAAVKLTKTLIDSADDHRLSGRVFNALEHYSLAQTSVVSRVKLVNLWSALECLTAGDEFESIIAAACYAVVPLVVWRRTGKILSYTAKNLLALQKIVGGSFGPGFDSPEHGLSNQQLVVALGKPEGHPHVEELQRFALQHPLLGHRIHSLWKTFCSPTELANELKLSEERTEWHLYRIYRARNLVVHEGHEVKHLPHLLGNLHYYFSFTLSRILHGMHRNHTWSVADSIMYWRTHQAYVMESLEQAPQRLVTGDILPLLKSKEDYIWPTETKE